MIEVDGLSKRYGAALAVDGLSFTVQPGRVTGFLGPNGAGKSTTMRLVLGLDRPSSGNCRILGRPYARHRFPLHEVGALLDATAVHDGRTASSHLLSLAQASRIPRSRVREVLDLVGLDPVARRRVRGFSLGMKQRLGIAAAMLGQPAVLLFDEPINGLDPEGIQWIRGLLRGLADEGHTVLLSSHLMSEMALTADHLIVIGRGRLIADAPIAALVDASDSSYLSVRSPQQTRFAGVLERAGARVAATQTGLQVRAMTAEAVGDLAAEHQVTLHELAAHTASLETAFFELTADASDYHAGPRAAAELTSPAARP